MSGVRKSQMISKLPYPRVRKIHIYKTNKRIKPSPLVINLSPEVVKWEKLNKSLSKSLRTI